MIHIDTRSKGVLAEFLINSLFALIPDRAKDKKQIKELLIKYVKKNI